MAKKICPHHFKRDGYGICRTKCPKNTNSRCQIVPKKPKMVKVKAFFIQDKNTGIEAWEMGASSECPLGSSPCYILIAEKHLKGR